MDLFRRIGTQKKKFKVQFFIGRLKFSSYKPGKIYIVVKRGKIFIKKGDFKVKEEKINHFVGPIPLYSFLSLSIFSLARLLAINYPSRCV